MELNYQSTRLVQKIKLQRYTPAGAINPVAKAEIYSIHIENLLRCENNIGLRAFYSINNSTGIPLGEGPVLISGTSQNANTINANGLNFVNPTY